MLSTISASLTVTPSVFTITFQVISFLEGSYSPYFIAEASGTSGCSKFTLIITGEEFPPTSNVIGTGLGPPIWSGSNCVSTKKNPETLELFSANSLKVMVTLPSVSILTFAIVSPLSRVIGKFSVFII